MTYKTPIEMFYHWERSCPDKIFLRQPINDEWHEWTWKQAGIEARKMAAALRKPGLPPHSNIAFISKNCAHWIICDLAIMMSGHVSVPLYPNLTADSIHQILEHCEAPVLFVGKLDDWHLMKPGVPPSVRCISFPFYSHNEYEQWNYITQQHTIPADDIYRDLKELATIIYTSGTTGLPKGVMLSFHNLGFAATHIVQFLRITNQDSFFSYLPAAHIAERWIVEMGCLYSGAVINYAESIEKFSKNLQHVQPTMFLGVHRIWKKFQEGVLVKVPDKKLQSLLRIPGISYFVKRKIKKALGLSKAKRIGTGAAPTPPELLHWFKRLGIEIMEGYGMTENTGYSHGNPPNDIRIGTVGKPLPECDVKLGENNEVVVRHDGLMMGYYKDPEQTKAAFTDDGFLRTGDEGLIDKNGYLTITGRIKDIFKTSKGKYVVPAPIESKILVNTDIEYCCVVGTGMPQPVSLVTLSESGKKKTKEELTARFAEMLTNINVTLNHHERLFKIIVTKEGWNADNGMLTPTFKIKRNSIEKKYRFHFDKWQNESEELIWEI